MKGKRKRKKAPLPPEAQLFTNPERGRPLVSAVIDELTERIEALIREVDPIHLLGALSAMNTIGEADNNGRRQYVEYVALLVLQHEFKEGLRTSTGEEEEQIQEWVGDIFQKTLVYHMSEGFGGEAFDKDNSDEAGHRLRQQAITHGLSMPAPGQQSHLRELTKSLFEPFDDLIFRVLGFTVDDALKITAELPGVISQHLRFHSDAAAEAKLLRQAVRSHSKGRESGSHWDTRPQLLEALGGLKEEKLLQRSRQWARGYVWREVGESYSIDATAVADATGCTVEVVEAFLEAFSTNSGSVELRDKRPAVTHDLQERPLVAFAGRKYGFLLWLLNWALRPRFEVAIRDSSERSWQRYFQHRGNVTEQLALSLVSKAVGGVEAHHSLRYPDPDTGGETELDGLIQVDDELLLIEAKAGALTAAARRGAPIGLVKDIDKILVYAHNQALRASRFVNENDVATFKAEDGSDFELRREEVEETILITVSLDALEFITPSLHELAPLGLFQAGSKLPWAVSLLDLWVISDLCTSSTQFVQYIRQRMLLNEVGKLHAVEELDYFAYFLQAGTAIISMDISEPDFVYMEPNTEGIEAYYRYEMGLTKTPVPKPAWNIHPQTRMLIRELEKNADRGFLKMAFYLLQFPHQAMEAISKIWAARRGEVRKDGQTKGYSYFVPSKKLGFTVYVGGARSVEECMELLQTHVMLRKYQNHSEAWLGALEMVGQRGIMFCFDMSPWEYDEGLEEGLKVMKLASMDAG